MLFLLTVLDVLELAINDGVESGFRGVRHLPASFLFELCTEVDLALFLCADLQVNSSGYFLRNDMGVRLNTVRYPSLALNVPDDAVSCPVSLIQEEGTLNLILALLVSRRSRLMRHVPAVVVDVACVAAAVSCLRLCLSDFGVGKSLGY